MYGPRGAMGGGYSGYEGAMRQRMIDSSNPYFAARNTPDASILSKRARPQNPYPNPYYYPPAPLNNYNSNIPGSSSISINSFPVVRLRGLPFNSEDLDVYKFFAGLDVVDCLLVNRNGRFSGEAFAVLSSPMQVELALARSGQHIGRRYVEVFKCLKHDYYNAIAEEVVSGGSYEPSPPRPKRSRVTTANAANALSSVKEEKEKEKMEYTQVLKLRGLPYSATVSDIVEFFKEYGIEEEKVVIALRSDGKATGEGYVEFESVEKAKEAMCKDRNMIGSRYVELFPSTVEDMRRAVSRFRD